MGATPTIAASCRRQARGCRSALRLGPGLASYDVCPECLAIHRSQTAGDAVRVLVVDDTSLVLDVLAAALSSEPAVEVVTTPSAIGLSGLARRIRPHVAIVDVQMPALGGSDAVRALGKAWPPARVVLSSSIPAEALAALAAELGVSHIPKAAGAARVAAMALDLGRARYLEGA